MFLNFILINLLISLQMTKVSYEKKENSTPVKGKPIKSKVGTPGQSNRPVRLSRNKGKTYYIFFPECGEAFFETTQADRDAKEKELLKKDIKFTTKETLMFEYVNKFIHKHNLDWQKKEKSYMKTLLSQKSVNEENPLENRSPDPSQEGE